MTFSVSNPVNGTVHFDPVSKQITFTPDFNFFGIGSFTYTATDEYDESISSVVTVNVKGGDIVFLPSVTVSCTAAKLTVMYNGNATNVTGVSSTVALGSMNFGLSRTTTLTALVSACSVGNIIAQRNVSLTLPSVNVPSQLGALTLRFSGTSSTLPAVSSTVAVGTMTVQTFIIRMPSVVSVLAAGIMTATGAKSTTISGNQSLVSLGNLLITPTGVLVGVSSTVAHGALVRKVDLTLPSLVSILAAGTMTTQAIGNASPSITGVRSPPAIGTLTAQYSDSGSITGVASTVSMGAITTTSAPTVWNAADLVNISLSNNNLTASTTNSSNGGVRSTVSRSGGLLYAEYTLDSANTVGSVDAVGFANSSWSPVNIIGLNNNSLAVDATGIVNLNSVAIGSIQPEIVGSTLGMAVNFTAKKVWFTVNGTTWNNSTLANQNPATNTGGFLFTNMVAGPYKLAFGGHAAAAGGSSVTGSQDVPTPNGSFIGTGGNVTVIVDNAGGAWNITGGQVFLNGTVDNSITGVTVLLWLNGVIYRNTTNHWWRTQPNTIAWVDVSTTDPRAGINYIPNAGMTGAVVGSPGTLPTTWFSNMNTGLVQTVVGFGTTEPTTGFPYIDIKVAGTTTANATNTYVSMGSSNNLPLATSTAYDLSLYVGLAPGTTATNLLSNGFEVDENVNGAFTTAFGNTGAALNNSSMQRYNFSFTTTATGPITINPFFKMNFGTGACSGTFRLSGPQLQTGTVATTFTQFPFFASELSFVGPGSNLTSFRDNKNSVWSLSSGGQVIVNGVTDTQTAGVVGILLHSATPVNPEFIYHLVIDAAFPYPGNWWQAPSGSVVPVTWTNIGATDPRGSGYVWQPMVRGPANVVLPISTQLAIGGITLTDEVNQPQLHAGSCALNISCSAGTLSVTLAGAVGNGTSSISVNDIFTNCQSAASSLKYTSSGSGGSDLITVQFFNQFGTNSTLNIPVAVSTVPVNIKTVNAGEQPFAFTVPSTFVPWDNIPPNAPLNFQGAANGASVNLTWDAPTIATQPITYSVAYKLHTASNFTPYTSGLTVTSFTVPAPPLVSGQTYDFQVTATNSLGSATTSIITVVALQNITGDITGTTAFRIADMMELFGVNCYPNGQDGATTTQASASTYVTLLNSICGGSGMGMFCRIYANGLGTAAADEAFIRTVCGGVPFTQFTSCVNWNGSSLPIVQSECVDLAASNPGYLFSVENYNEPDSGVVQSNGLPVPVATCLSAQQSLWSTASGRGVNVLLPSITANSGPTFETDYMGSSLSSFVANANYSNVHIYPNNGAMNGSSYIWTGPPDYVQATTGLPSVATEFHPTLYNGASFNSATNAQYYTPIALLSGFVDHDLQGLIWWTMYDYAGFAPAPGLFTGFTSNLSLAALSMRAMYQLCPDLGGASRHSFSPTKLDYSISGLPAAAGFSPLSGGRHALFEASSGTFYLFIWNEQNNPGGTAVPITVNFLSSTMSQVVEYSITSAAPKTVLQTVNNVTSVALHNGLGAEVRLLVITYGSQIVRTESPSGTSITTANNPVIIGSSTPGVAGTQEETYIISSGVASPPGLNMNGVIQTSSANVAQIYYIGHTLYQLGSGNWYGFIGATDVNGQATFNIVAATPAPTFTFSATTITATAGVSETVGTLTFRAGGTSSVTLAFAGTNGANFTFNSTGAAQSSTVINTSGVQLTTVTKTVYTVTGATFTSGLNYSFSVTATMA